MNGVQTCQLTYRRQEGWGLPPALVSGSEQHARQGTKSIAALGFWTNTVFFFFFLMVEVEPNNHSDPEEGF